MKNLLEKFKDLRKVLARWLVPCLTLYLCILLLKAIDLYQPLISFLLAFKPLLYGLVLALAMQPFVNGLRKYISNRSAVLVIYGGTILCFFLFLFILMPVLINELAALSETMQEWGDQLFQFLKTYGIDTFVNDDFKRTLMNTSADAGMKLVMNSISGLTVFSLSYMIAIFISFDFDEGVNTFKKYVINHEQWFNFYKTVSAVVVHYLMGTLVDLMYIFLTSTAVLMLFNFPNSLLYAGLLALLNLFPYIGPTVGIILIALAGFLHFEQFPLFCVVAIWVLQQIEANCVQPLIFHKAMDVHPLYLFAALLGGEALFGVLGLILSPILAGILQIAVRSYLHAANHQSVGGWEDIFW